MAIPRRYQKYAPEPPSVAETCDAKRMSGYPGGKSGPGVFQRIISLIPPHEIYIEPFMGGFSIGRLKRPAKLNIGIDRDRAAVENCFAEVGSGTGKGPLARTTPESAISAAATETGESSRSARDSLIGGMVDRGAWKYTAPFAGSRVGIIDTSGSRWIFHEGDGIEFLLGVGLYRYTMGQAPQTLIYCDPPYMRATCKTRCRYKYDMTDDDHRRLLRVLQDLNALPDPPMLMISGYDSELYRQAFSAQPGDVRWNHTQFQAMTRGRKPATEHLWFNFAPPTVLHDYRYVGTGFRDRERIKRAQQTWTRKLQRLKPYERQALLAAIKETAPEPSKELS